MNTIWKRLAKDKSYREEFALAMLKRMIPYQTRAIRKKRRWSQAELAASAKVTQGVISRAEDPDYGNLTLTTIGRIAAGFDLAAVIRFVPFSELMRYSDSSTEREFADLKTFSEEGPSAQTGGSTEQPAKIGATPASIEGYQENNGGDHDSGNKLEQAADFANDRKPAGREVVPPEFLKVG